MTDTNIDIQRLKASKSAQVAQNLKAFETRQQVDQKSPSDTPEFEARQKNKLNSPYLTQAQAAEYLHISERTLERLRHEGLGARYRKAGRRVLYLPEDLDAWLNERTFVSTAEARSNGVR